MAQTIEHICEPDRLTLTWQSPDLNGVRTRFGVAELIREGDDALLVYREDETVEEAKSLGYAGYPAFRTRELRHAGALRTFMRRLPPRERSDFHRYLSLFRLPHSGISDFGLLGYTEAKLPSDGFALVNELSQSCIPSEHFLEIAGFRHYLNDNSAIEVGDQLGLAVDDDNPHDSNAVSVVFRGKKVGNVNRFQAPTFRNWLIHGQLDACLERRNGTLDRPRAFMFVFVRP